ncbi:glycosyltransferase [Variovorax sp. AFSI2.2]|uniref:glycosyltransferase n=1 Tax=Variovorax sp. AFSI2.2 TaxID=3384160 RepID=UPI003EB6A011
MTYPDPGNLLKRYTTIVDLDEKRVAELSDCHGLPKLAESLENINFSSAFVDGTCIRRYLADCLQQGSFEIICPRSGRRIAAEFSVVLRDKSTFVIFDGLVLGIGHLGLGFPIMAIIFPEEGLFLKLIDDYWGVQERHLPMLADVISAMRPGPSKGITLVSGDANFAHHAWNQLSVLQSIVDGGVKCTAQLISTHEPLGPMPKLFPELSHWTMHRVPDWELEHINQFGKMVLPLGGTFVQQRLVERLLHFAVTLPKASEIESLFSRVEKYEGPILWMSVRTRNRTALNQTEALIEIGTRFLSICPTGSIILDGHSFADDLATNPGYAPAAQREVVTEDLQVAHIVANKLRSEKGAHVRVEFAVGLTISETILLAQYATFYFCHHGTVQHKIGWFTSCSGVVHCNRRTTQALPAHYVKNQSEIASLPAYTPLELIDAPDHIQSEEALQQALKTENYRFVSIAAIGDFVVDEMEKHWATLTKGRVMQNQIQNNIELHAEGYAEKQQPPRRNSLRLGLKRLYKKLNGSSQSTALGQAPLKELRREILDSGEFDWKFYALSYTDVPHDAEAALSHFITIGLEQGRHPSLRFSPAEYLAANSDVGSIAKTFLHYIRSGHKESRSLGRVPAALDYERAATQIRDSGLFDEEEYLRRLPAAKATPWDPVMHYLAVGSKFSVEPLKEYSLNRYVALYPDLRNAEVNPLIHWLSHGCIEGRKLPTHSEIHKWVDSRWTYPLPDDEVNFEIMAGEAFFCAHGFNFVNRETKGHFRECIETLMQKFPGSSTTKKPVKASIIIPVYGQLDYVLNCLDSLAGHKSEHTFEIIVCDDASPDEGQMLELKRIPWIRYVRRPENGGFIECCNFAAALAEGEIFVFLNSDTRVVDGWLDELIWSLENLKDAGLVGSKLLNADGSLQEAGGIIWRDGSAYNYGRGDNSNQPRYCFARPADYISGASIAIRGVLWRQLNGFDSHFSPAYCEDVDLAFRVREQGHQVWFQPLSRVIHYEGITHGRSTATGVKAYQVENLRKVRERYSDVISTHPAVGASLYEASMHRSRKRMIVLDALTPTPDQDSGSIMTFETMQIYRELGFEQHFLPMHSPFWMPKYTFNLQRAGVCCHYQPFTSRVAEIGAQCGGFDLALIYRHEVANMTYDDVREFMPTAPVIFANVDLHYLRESRGAQMTGDERGTFRAQITKSSELRMFAEADASFVHTAVEREIVNTELPKSPENIILFPWLAESVEVLTDFQQRKDIMFLGNFPHTPNVDSILYFVQEMWPHIEPNLPADARLLVVGNKPPPEVMALASDRIIVTGFVEDLTPHFAMSRVFVAPLRFGAGIKGKIINSFAHGVPCVASTIAAEGIAGAKDSHLLVQDDPLDFARDVINLYSDEAKWHFMQAAGLEFLRKNYSRSRATEICTEGLQVASRVWMRRQEHQRSAALRKIMIKNGDLTE